MKINPKPIPGQQGFRCTFRHPISKKISTFGLATQDATDAEASCRDIEMIFAESKLLDDPRSPRLLAFKPRAVEIALQSTYGNDKGKDYAAQLFQRKNKPALDPKDIGTLAGRIITILDADKSKKNVISEILKQYESVRYAEVQEECRKLQNQVKVLQPLAEELERYRRAANKHVQVTIREAADAWKAHYVDGHAEKTVKEANKALDSFVESLPDQDRQKLGIVKPQQIDEWLSKLRNEKDGTKISQVTKRKNRAYLSSFFTWAFITYDLAENPLKKTSKIAGITAESIVAIRRLKDLNDFIQTLKDQPYWQALAATAVFAGPRYAELCWLKIDDVYLEENYIRITSRTSGKRHSGTKTGRERNVPIESTTFKAILEKHVAARKAEQRQKNATVAQKSEWLFPSTVPENEYKPRTKTPPGIWSDNGVFTDAWRAAVERVQAKHFKEDEPMPAFWQYGPAEWRHTFGTILGHCGWSSLEISNAMGNSEAIARRFYIVPTKSANQRWDFKF